MTAIKQTSVCSEKHLARLRDYLSWDRDKALAHGTQNIIDDDRWFQEMADTRAAMGHDRPGKAGAKCTYMQHQILGFLPDECDLNGGKMTPELCMRYAREYVAERYPNQEVVMVLHRERCRADATDRYAVHLGINRSDLETGRRLDEGPAKMTFPSVTPFVPACVWGERELRDMFGLIPEGLPDRRRLVLPDDWPSGLYPLRKDSMDYRFRPADCLRWRGHHGTLPRSLPRCRR